MTGIAEAAVVLFVEDDLAVRLLGVQCLEEAGFAVLQAGCVAEALAVLASRNDIAVVVTDVNLPGERDGSELAQLLSRQAPWLRTILTSGARLPIQTTSPFLAKPYRADDLVRLVTVAAVAACRPDWGRSD